MTQPQRFRITIDGGVTIATGIRTTAALLALPTVRRQRRVYVRCTTNDAECVMYHQQPDGQLLTEATAWGEPCPMPTWADGFTALFTHT